jgi:adenine-specific DNA-methyltransferase
VTGFDSAAKRLEDMTREELLDLVYSQREDGIRITFAGKDVAKRIARKVQPRTSRRFAKYSVGTEEEQARSLVIEGENLQAMVTLHRERGKVDLILADPPYNTGRDFRYNDRWDEDPNDPDLGDLVTEDDGARHTKWMKFMWPRLKVMWDLLKPSGVLAICVDERELFHLGKMLDELFKPERRLAIINWEKSYAPRADNRHVSTATEYVLVYAKDEEMATTGLLPRTAEMDARYRSPDGDARLWKADNASGMSPDRQEFVYAIQSPFTGRLEYPPYGSRWRPPQREVVRALEEWGCKFKLTKLDDDEKRAAIIGIGVNELRPAKAILLDQPLAEARRAATEVLKAGPWPRIFFGHDGQGRPQLKRYLEEVKQGKVPTTYWADDDWDSPLFLGAISWDHEQSGHSQSGVNELTAIVGTGHNFQTVKPLKLFSKIIHIWCPPDGLVLDPFAGSGTTGHAVLQLNKDGGANRRFILIEQGRPEKGDPYARSLMANRLRRVIEGDWANGKGYPTGGGYRFSQLQKKVDAKALLSMERDEMTDAVVASHYDANRRGGPGLVIMTNEGYDYLVARNAADEGFYLVWDGSPEPPVFDEATYDAVVSEAVKAKLKPVYHVYARFNLFQSDDVRFYQIPDQILIDFGVSVNEPFNNESENEC